jgi:hypothetical protein
MGDEVMAARDIPERRRPVAWEDPVLKCGPDGGMAIIQGLVDTMRELPAVGKDSRHEAKGDDKTGTWNYRSADAVVTAVGPAMAKAGVVCVPTVVGDDVDDSGRIRLAMEYRFFAVDGSSMVVQIIAHAMGRTAYTIGAGYSYAIKYALSQLLCIPFDDDRMDMESASSVGAAREDWWAAAGWESVEEHDGRRRSLLETIQAMPEANQRAVKLRLVSTVGLGTYNPSGVPMPKTTGVWVPVKESQPGGPGRLVFGLSPAAMVAAEEAAEEFVESARQEAAGEEPFEVESSPRGESEDADPPPKPARRQRAKPQEATRTARKPQEATKPVEAAVTSPGPGNASEGLQGVEWESGMYGMRTALASAFLRLSGEYATQVEAALTDDDLWPIDSIPPELVEEAAELVAPIFEAAAAAVKR